MPRVSARLSSQVTRRASRPLRAAQKPVATTATPVGTGTTWVTPFTRRAAVASNDFTVAPKRGGRAMSAVSIPGSARSIVNCADPSVFALPSTRRSSLPTSLKSLGSFSVTWAGGVRAAAFDASSPNVARRPDGACDTTPRSTVISVVGTPHSRAAASTSMARAVAPARRICSHELAMAVLPPVSCMGPNARLLYRSASAGAASTRICDQSASSSSARMVASPVWLPWPISMCLPTIVTVLSGAMRTKALGARTSSAAAAWSSRRNPTTSAAPASAVV